MLEKGSCLRRISIETAGNFAGVRVASGNAWLVNNEANCNRQKDNKYFKTSSAGLRKPCSFESKHICRRLDTISISIFSNLIDKTFDVNEEV